MATINAYEGQDIMILDVPNTFIQTNMPPNKDDEERLITKITCVLVNVILELGSETYSSYVVFENGKKIIYVVFFRSIYGMIVAGLLFYKKFCGDLENIGFQLNIYDPYGSNRIIVGKKHTFRVHVDDVMSSHVNHKG